MASFPGYTQPSNLWLDAGVLFKGDPASGGVALGASRGGFTFDPGMTIRQVDWDGQHAPVATLDRVITWKSLIKGKMIEWTAASSLVFEVGGASDGSAGTNTITPTSAGQLFLIGAYGVDLFLIGRQQGTGKIVRVHFPLFLCTKYSLATKPHNEGEVDVEFEARIASGANLESPPYTIQFLT